MRLLTKLLLIPLVLVSLDKLIRTQTNGFRIQKIYQDFPFNAHWEVENPPLPSERLDQPFRFLGSGVQFYAFLGEDEKTVLKLFKHYHFGLSTTQLRKTNRFKKTITNRTKRIERLFHSAKLALDPLAEETGVFYVSLNPKPQYPTVTLYDKIGIKYPLDLSKSPFILQHYACSLKKGDTATPTLPQNIHFNDRARRNFGTLDGKLVYIDIGSFEEAL